jgi:uncharacterized Fe-S cluster-containing MiaB family protein
MQRNGRHYWIINKVLIEHQTLERGKKKKKKKKTRATRNFWVEKQAVAGEKKSTVFLLQSFSCSKVIPEVQ